MAKKINAVTAATTATSEPAKHQKNPSNVSQPDPENAAPPDALALGTLVSLPNTSKVQQQSYPSPDGMSTGPSGSGGQTGGGAVVRIAGGLAGGFIGGFMSGFKGGSVTGDPCVESTSSPMAAIADFNQRNRHLNAGQTHATNDSTVTLSTPTALKAAAPNVSVAIPASASVLPATVTKATPIASVQPVASTIGIDRTAVVASPIVVSHGAVVLGSSVALIGLGGAGLRLR